MISWKCKHTWKKSAVNTSWCLLGCSIGDFGTILYFQNNPSDWSTMSIMSLAMLNGLITSVLLETFILSKQMTVSEALRTALGMSFISMLAMEMAMNLTDILLTGGAQITWWVTPIMLTAGFLTPWPYNYWRLKKYNASCH
ncbi:MAG: DUF4396 domain-containing protein [Candidatus Marinimicrobia bacterium]|jgi:hypothetical protein|nr:DUF4396 domain-containing protein [Candidatus Neomarinimicrobiota bacterium]